MKNSEKISKTSVIMSSAPVHSTVSDEGFTVPKYGVQLKVDNDLFFYEVPRFLIQKVQNTIFNALRKEQQNSLKNAMSTDNN